MKKNSMKFIVVFIVFFSVFNLFIDCFAKVDGPAHSPQSLNTGGDNVINRKHICATQGYLPNPNNPENGHLKRCYSKDCEFYKKGISGTEQKHQYRQYDGKTVQICVVCRYEKGSNLVEPKILYSRDFGLDIMQTEFSVVSGKTTEIEVNIVGVEKDLKIYYGLEGETLKKSIPGRDDENSVSLKWDVKDPYAKKALNFGLKKDGEKKIVTIDIKDGYTKDINTKVDFILENQFKEKRIETVELKKESAERAAFILKFSSDMISSIGKGETKDITVICEHPDYEDVNISWECKGGINVEGESGPDEKGIVKAKIIGIEITNDNELAELIVKATAKYKNDGNGDIFSRELKKGIRVYEKQASEVSTSTGNVDNRNNNNKTSSNRGNNRGSNKNSLPIAASAMGLIGIIVVAVVINNSTKR